MMILQFSVFNLIPRLIEYKMAEFNYKICIGELAKDWLSSDRR